MKTKTRVLILLDWKPETDSLILESFRRAGLDYDTIGIDFHQSMWTPMGKIFSHWPRCLWASLKAFGKRREYDYMIAWSQAIGTFLGLIKFFTFSASPRIFIMDVAIVERSNPIVEYLRRFVIATAWKRVNHISFVSHAYMCLIQERLDLGDKQCVHLKLPHIVENDPQYCGFIPGSYLYAVGRSYRDYETLLNAARKCSRHFVILTGGFALKGLKIPENVTVRHNVFGDEADRLMQDAAAVVIPLERTTSPAGEWTLLEAMCYGKPVIITDTLITREYIVHGVNGFLVPCKDSDAIVEAVNIIFSDPERACAVGQTARKTVIEDHHIDGYAQRIAEIIIKDLGEANCRRH